MKTIYDAKYLVLLNASHVWLYLETKEEAITELNKCKEEHPNLKFCVVEVICK